MAKWDLMSNQTQPRVAVWWPEVSGTGAVADDHGRSPGPLFSLRGLPTPSSSSSPGQKLWSLGSALLCVLEGVTWLL
jgi:hypothetical protein